jgi:hypothetical protein
MKELPAIYGFSGFFPAVSPLALHPMLQEPAYKLQKNKRSQAWIQAAMACCRNPGLFLPEG